MNRRDRHNRTGRFEVPLLLLFPAAFGIWLRVAGLKSEFWFDEILSYNLSRNAPDLMRVLRIFHDNNHPLNTIYLYLLGPGAPVWYYRLFPFSCGLLSLLVVYTIVSRQGLPEKLAAFSLFLLSYPVIVYSTEARGYSSLILFSLSSYYTAVCFFKAKKKRFAALFWFLVVPGLLSHASFAHVLLALAAWGAAELKDSPEGPKAAVKEFLVLFGVPLIVSVAYYLLFFRHLPPVSGAQTSWLIAALSASSLALGGPRVAEWNSGWPIAAIFAAAAWVVFICQTSSFYRTRDKRWIFYFTVIFASPIISLTVLKPPALFERYFLVSIIFFYLLTANFIAVLFSKGGFRRFLAFSLAALFLTGSSFRALEFIKEGRGAYTKALTYIEDHTKGPEVSLGSDDDLRHTVMLQFYLPRMRFKKSWYYQRYASTKPLKDPPRWLLSHHVNFNYSPPSRWRSKSGAEYELIKSYPCRGLSCFSYYVYSVRK